MRRTFLLMTLLAIGLAGYAQKQKKPNINKADLLRGKGELAEAKEIIDLAIDYEKTKDNGKTWYYRALIYATIDTTSNPQYASLKEGALDNALEAFGKAEELGDPEKEFFVTEAAGIFTQTQQVNTYYAYYFDKAVKAFEGSQFEEAIMQFYNAGKVLPADTNAYKNAAYAAHNGEIWDKAVNGYTKAIEKGARSKDMYSNLTNIYTTVKEDKESALDVVGQGREVYPNDSELAKIEINLLIQLDKVEEAKNNLLAAIEEEPENTNLIFTLAAMYEELEDEQNALKTYEQAIEVDENHFESNFNRGVILLNGANEVFKEYSSLGISQADMKKSKELEPKIESKYAEALPQWKKLWSIRPQDRQIGETLAYIYSKLKKFDEMERVQEAVEQLPPVEE
ncbi:MAG: hypothetical protein JXR03_12850 [Cyclobacteriaceae bacterium]